MSNERINNMIKFAYPLTLKELSPFYDLKETAHKLGVVWDKQIAEKKDVQKILNTFYKAIAGNIQDVRDYSNVKEKAFRGEELKIIESIRLVSDGTSNYVEVCGRLFNGLCDIVCKGARGYTSVTKGVVVNNNTRIRLNCIYDSYYGEKCSVAILGDNVKVAIEYADAGEGSKGKNGYYITAIINSKVLLRDRLEKYGGIQGRK